MKYRKEIENERLKEMSIAAHMELFKSQKYDSEELAWFGDRLAEILAENKVWPVKTDISILFLLAVSLFIGGGIIVGVIFGGL